MIKPYYIRKIPKHGRMTKLPDELRGYYMMIIPLNIKDDKKGHHLSRSCYRKANYCEFQFMGDKCKIYTNGFTHQIRPLISIIKNKVLTDCRNNPKKWLEETKLPISHKEGRK